MHLDAWGSLKYVDGYNITISSEIPNNSENKLYFVNLGGYDRSEFTELHKNVFVVAPNESKAKVKALKQILDWESHHKDYLFEAENILDISKTISAKNLYIHLEPTDIEQKFEFTCKYLPIGKNS